MKTDPDEEYTALEGRIDEAIGGRAIDEEEFRVLALDIYHFQRRRNHAYARYCEQVGSPNDLRDWREIPAVPQSAFKLAELRAFEPVETVRTFHTSGTTGEGFGRHHFCSLALYHRAVISGWDYFGLPHLPKIILTPRPAQKPHSSLAEMMDVLPGTAQFFMGDDGQLRTDELVQRLRWQEDAAEPAMLLGTALAFLHFFELCAAQGLHFSLPAGSVAMETGGYKGSGRDIPKAQLYRMFGEFLDLAPDKVFNEYGMTELSSQCYTRGLGEPHEAPPWLRAIVIDPETGREAAVGQAGVLRLFDLANLGSVLAIETQDLAVRATRGFQLLGRDPEALPRGCSRAADAVLRPR